MLAEPETHRALETLSVSRDFPVATRARETVDCSQCRDGQSLQSWQFWLPIGSQTLVWYLIMLLCASRS